MKTSINLIWSIVIISIMAACSNPTPQSTPTISQSETETTITPAYLDTQTKSLSPVFTETLLLTPIPSSTLQATPTDTLLPTMETTTKWIEYWDARYHYGFAIPCHWTIYPTGMEGIQSALVLMNYDERYVKEHTDKGNWIGDWGMKTIKMDLIMFESIDLDLATDEAVRQILNNDMQRVDSTEEKMFGSHVAILAEISSIERPENRVQIIAFRISLDKILTIAAYPLESWETTDVQGVLGSFAFTDQEVVGIPPFPPIAPIIAIPESCNVN